MKRAIINVRIYDFDEYIENGFVMFDDEIIEVGPMSAFAAQDLKIIDGKGKLLMPGLVCGHTHIYSTFARGLSLPFNPKNFQEILDQMWWKLDRQLDNETTYHSGIVSACDFAKNGVTTLIDHHASGTDIAGSLAALKRAVVDEVGLRGAFAFETSDRFYVEASIEENVAFAQQCQTGKAAGLFGLHASMSLSEATLQKVKRRLGNLPIHIHVAESNMDQADCRRQYKETVIERLNRHGLMNPDSIYVHAIHVDDGELKLIKETGGVIAVNVSSNMNNGVGLPNIMDFMKHGIPVIAGNDGLSSAMAHEYLNIHYAMHHHGKTPMAFGLGQVQSIIAATYAYASRILKTKLGRIRPGYVSDFVLLPYDPPTPIDQTNAFGHLFFGLFHSFKPSDVYVAGRHIVANYGMEPKVIDKYRKAQDVSRKLWQRLQQEE